jgi:hypothetical protein
MICFLGSRRFSFSQVLAALAMAASNSLRHPVNKTWPCLTISTPKASTKRGQLLGSRVALRNEPLTKNLMIQTSSVCELKSQSEIKEMSERGLFCHKDLRNPIQVCEGRREIKQPNDVQQR